MDLVSIRMITDELEPVVQVNLFTPVTEEAIETFSH